MMGRGSINPNPTSDDEEAGGSPGGPMQALLRKPRVSLRAITSKTGETRTEIERRGSAMVQAVKQNPVIGCIKNNFLTLATLFGVIFGIALGFILRASQEEKWTPRNVMYVKFVGDLFLRMLKMLIVPLIVSSLISAVGGLDLSLSRKIGLRAVSYYMVTTAFAVVLGIILVVVIHPGKGDMEEIERSGDARNVTTVDTLMDLLRNVFPPNLVQATIESYRTVLIPPEDPAPETASEEFNNMIYDTTPTPAPRRDLLKWGIKYEFFQSTNILGLVMFSFIFGVAICQMGERGKILQEFFHALADAMMTITSWVILVSPIGVASLSAGQVLAMDDLSVIVGQLGMYFLTVLLGILIHGIITLPLMYTLVTRQLPFRFILNMMEAIMTAFGTSSSSATLPVTFRCLENKNGIDQRVSRFVLPIGATINMDGTALYEAVAAIFIAQMRGMALGIGTIIAISITSTAASIGAAGIPSAGLVTLVMVLDTVGLPAEDVTLIIAVDWLLDRFRTACNVFGDSIGAAMVAHLSSKEVNDMDIAHRRESMAVPTMASASGAPVALEMASSDWDKANGGRVNDVPVESTNM